MKELIAISPILFENQNYKPGDKLPIHNPEFVSIWLCNSAAIWRDNGEAKKQKVKARPASASAGLFGSAYPSAGPEQDLIGKTPAREIRGARPEPAKGRKKSNA